MVLNLNFAGKYPPASVQKNYPVQQPKARQVVARQRFSLETPEQRTLTEVLYPVGHQQAGTLTRQTEEIVKETVDQLAKIKLGTWHYTCKTMASLRAGGLVFAVPSAILVGSVYYVFKNPPNLETAFVGGLSVAGMLGANAVVKYVTGFDPRHAIWSAIALGIFQTARMASEAAIAPYNEKEKDLGRVKELCIDANLKRLSGLFEGLTKALRERFHFMQDTPTELNKLKMNLDHFKEEVARVNSALKRCDLPFTSQAVIVLGPLNSEIKRIQDYKMHLREGSSDANHGYNAELMSSMGPSFKEICLSPAINFLNMSVKSKLGFGHKISSAVVGAAHFVKTAGIATVAMAATGFAAFSADKAFHLSVTDRASKFLGDNSAVVMNGALGAAAIFATVLGLRSGAAVCERAALEREIYNQNIENSVELAKTELLKVYDGIAEALYAASLKAGKGNSELRIKAQQIKENIPVVLNSLKAYPSIKEPEEIVAKLRQVTDGILGVKSAPALAAAA